MDTSTHKDAAALLRDARLRIEKVGWAKNIARRADGAVCLSQALTDVDGKKYGVKADEEARRIVLNLTGATAIPIYNDRIDTTKEDVLTLLIAAERVALEHAG